MAYTTIDNPELYFQTVLWTGNGSSSRSITLDGSEDMQPDWTWIKSRAGSESSQQHYLYDSVRGATKYLQSSTNNAEGTKSNGLSAFASDGFTVGDDNANNASSTTYVAWNWKAGGSASSNSDGSITSSVSVNTTAGFSIVSYTGTFANATVGHGLGVAPKVIILKNRDSTNNWCVGHGSLGFDKHLALNETDAVGTDSSARFRGISPTSTVYSVGVAGETNGNSQDMIAYCLAEKQGYSKFGKYTGNGNADGTFVYTGFRPAWVMIKRTDGTNSWVIYDNKREGFNVDNDALQANGNNAEGTSDDLDFLSNGFKMRTSGVGENGSGNSYIFIAFAESPFVNSNGVPTNAR